MIVGNSLKAALHRPVHQQIADHTEQLIGMAGATHPEITRVQGVIEGLRLALFAQEDVFKGTGNE